MLWKISTVIVTLLLINSPLKAETSGANSPDHYGTQGLQLSYTNPELSLEDFEYVAHRNQYLLGKAVMNMIDNNLESMGTAGTAIKFTGEAAYMAVKVANFNLNESKTMAIEMHHLADSDRKILYTIRLSW